MSVSSISTVALVGFGKEDESSLARILDRSESSDIPNFRWRTKSSPSVDSTVAALRNVQIPVVLCDRDRMPEAWKELLARFAALPEPPLLIVTSRLADDVLWAEALNLGAYDVLSRPFETSEVVRTVGLAQLRWQDRYRASRPGLAHMVAGARTAAQSG